MTSVPPAAAWRQGRCARACGSYALSDVDTWLGAAIGIALYVRSRLFAPAEDAELARTFGGRWATYRRTVWLPWL